MDRNCILDGTITIALPQSLPPKNVFPNFKFMSRFKSFMVQSYHWARFNAFIHTWRSKNGLSTFWFGFQVPLWIEEGAMPAAMCFEINQSNRYNPTKEAIYKGLYHVSDIFPSELIIHGLCPRIIQHSLSPPPPSLKTLSRIVFPKQLKKNRKHLFVAASTKLNVNPAGNSFQEIVIRSVKYAYQFPEVIKPIWMTKPLNSNYSPNLKKSFTAFIIPGVMICTNQYNKEVVRGGGSFVVSFEPKEKENNEMIIVIHKVWTCNVSSDRLFFSYGFNMPKWALSGYLGSYGQSWIFEPGLSSYLNVMRSEEVDGSWEEFSFCIFSS